MISRTQQKSNKTQNIKIKLFFFSYFIIEFIYILQRTVFSLSINLKRFHVIVIFVDWIAAACITHATAVTASVIETGCWRSAHRHISSVDWARFETAIMFDVHVPE